MVLRWASCCHRDGGFRLLEERVEVVADGDRRAADGRAYARTRSDFLRWAETAPRTSNGWRIKTLWAVAEDQQGLVKVRGDDIKTGAVVRFKVGEAAISTTGVLDPRKPGTVTAAGEPREFPSYLYFAASGCYELHASWPGGGWKMVLGVGR